MKPRATPRQRNKAPRIEPLSVLPVFLDLKGKTAVIVGDGNAALWKLELLASAGAKVWCVCKRPTPELLDLLSNSAFDISVETGNWRDLNFAGAAIIVADIAPEEAAAFFACALKHTSMVNVVDQPTYCTFQFGSIINKSPLVIGISTSGAGPVLAQYVRNLVEAMLPVGIQDRVRRAAAIRSRVNERLVTAGLRRDYWKAFFGRSFGFRTREDRDGTPAYVIKATSVEDLALRDIRHMQSADRIYFYSGADNAILSYGRREALRIEIKSLDAAICAERLPSRSVIVAPLNEKS